MSTARFAGKVALVSGAASGIGAAVVARLTEEGAAVVACDVTPIDGGVVCDVRDDRACAAAVAEALDRHGRLDVLANIAGVVAGNRIQDVTPDEWRRVLDVNLTGTFLLSQAALPSLLETSGAIVNMASQAGIRGTPYNAAYCASKGGVILLTKSMALELAKQGVRVNAVCPGSVRTPMLEGFTGGNEEALLGMGKIQPIGRLGTPSEVAEAIAWLCSDAASFVTGVALPVDGGVMAT